jgi:hypothetical protein
MRRIWLLAALITFFSCFVADAQQYNGPGKSQRCPNAWKITPADPKLAEKTDAWVSDMGNVDGILTLTYCLVFQPGLTTIKRLAPERLMQLPEDFEVHERYGRLAGETIRVNSLPIGFSLYKNLAFELRTTAIESGASISLRLPSVRTEEEFRKLFLLYLDEDSMVPGALQWQDYPDYLGAQKSDFRTRTLTAGFAETSVFHHATGTGRLIVASFNQEEYDRSAIDLAINSVVGPPVVKVGETFSYKISIVNSGGPGRPANDVVLLSSIINGRFVSARSTQGSCRQSVNSTPDIVCELGKVDPGKTVVMTIAIKADDHGMLADKRETGFSTINMLRSRDKDYNPENNHYQSRGTIIRN